jgi:Translation initiation factor IF-2, N-terminal region
MAGKVRVYALAHLLDVQPEQILAACREAGIHAKNSLSSLNESEQKTVQQRIGRKPSDDGGETQPALVPVWRPPPRLSERKRLSPP